MYMRNLNPENNVTVISSIRTVPAMVVKQAENIPMDANKLAEFQQQKLNQENMNKKGKIESFLNSTRLNANKIQKEKLQTSFDSSSNRKLLFEKQKSIKAKYTIVKKSEEPKKAKIQPVKVDWKPAEDIKSKMKVVRYQEDLASSDDEGADSEFDAQTVTTPQELVSFRENIRKAMLDKGK